jgi:dihydrodipicolinate synthase
MKFSGSYVALVTPFDENDNVNFAVLGNLIDFHLKSHTDGLVILGTTAEAATMTQEEKDEVVKFVVKRVNHQIPVVVGSGSNSTRLACLASKRYEELGADALLVITPYYNKTNHTGVIKHFKMIASSTSLPIIMYNVPSRTGMSLTYEEIKELKEIPNICGIKEASGNISFVAKVASLIDNNFSLLSGNDDQIVPVMSLGGDGVISVLANIAPSIVHNMTSLMLEGNYKDAYKLQLKYLDLSNDLFLETNPIPVKEALNYMGFNVGHVRLPLDEMGPKKEILHHEIDRLGEKIK